MKKHICKQCQTVYTYCRGCLLSPIIYHDNGFCSQECEDESKAIKIEEVVREDVEVVVIEEDTSTPKEDAIEYPYFFAATEDVTEGVVIETSEVIKPKKRNRKMINETVEENDVNDKEQDYWEAV